MRFKDIPLPIICLIAASCTVKRPLVVSSTSMGPGQEQVVGMATGRSEVTYLFGGIMLGQSDGSLKSALEDALAGTKAHTLINTYVDVACTYFPHPGFSILTMCETRVTGTAIRYRELKSNSYFEAMGKPVPDGYDLPGYRGEKKGITGDLLYKTMHTMYLTNKRLATLFFENNVPKYQKMLLDFVFLEKAKKRGSAWKVILAPRLDNQEVKFIHWFLKEFTQYVPANTPSKSEK